LNKQVLLYPQINIVFLSFVLRSLCRSKQLHQKQKLKKSDVTLVRWGDASSQLHLYKVNSSIQTNHSFYKDMFIFYFTVDFL